MLFVFIHVSWCQTWFPYPMMFNVAPFYNKTRSASNGTETTYLSRAHEDPLFYRGWCCSIFSFLCNVLSSIVCLSGGNLQCSFVDTFNRGYSAIVSTHKYVINIRWILTSWFEAIHKIHENWCITKNNQFTVTHFN